MIVVKCSYGHRAEAAEKIIAELQAENERLLAWKAEAVEVLNGWDQLWDEAGHPGPLGGLKSENVKQALIAERALADELGKHLKALCEHNYENRYEGDKMPCPGCYDAVMHWEDARK